MRLYSGGFDAFSFLELAVDSNSFSTYDLQECLTDTCAGDYAHHCRALSKLDPGDFSRKSYLNLQFVCLATEAKCFLRMRKVVRTDISFESDKVNFFAVA